MFRHPAFFYDAMRTEIKTSTYLLLLVFFVLGVYYPTLFSPLNSVDDVGMRHFLLNTDDLTIQGIFIPGGNGDYYRPILLSSFLADKYLWGLDESFMHLENIVFHLGNTLLLFVLTRRACLFQKQTTALVPFTAALFFAIHPLNTEAVNWVSGRTDLLAGFFLLTSVFFLMKQPIAWLSTLLAALCMLVACLAKETAIFFLPAALLFPYFVSVPDTGPVPIRCVFRSSWLHQAIFLTAGTAYFVFRSVAFSKGDLGVNRVITHVGGPDSGSLLISARLILKAAGFYTKKLLIPFPLNFGITHVSDTYLLLGLLVVAIFFWLLTLRTTQAYFFIIAGAIGSSALMIPLLSFTWTPLAERYMYIPLAFFVIGMSLMVQRWNQCSKYRLQLILSLSCLLGIALWGTVSRNVIWQDNLALFQDTLGKSPDFTPARNEIANALYARGRFQEASSIYKSFSDSQGLINAQYGLKNKAFALMNEGRYDEAHGILMKLMAEPGKHEVSILSQVLEFNKIRVAARKTTVRDVYPESVKVLTRLIELTGDPFYSYRLGITHLQVAEKEKALCAFGTVVKSAPPTAYYRNSAEKLVKKLAK